jgi:leucyl-tRNA synthetase
VRELWEGLGHRGGLMAASWPGFDAEVAKADEIVVSGAGERQGSSRLTVPAETSEEELERLALADAGVLAHTAGRR